MTSSGAHLASVTRTGCKEATDVFARRHKSVSNMYIELRRLGGLGTLDLVT